MEEEEEEEEKLEEKAMVRSAPDGSDNNCQLQGLTSPLKIPLTVTA